MNALSCFCGKPMQVNDHHIPESEFAGVEDVEQEGQVIFTDGCRIRVVHSNDDSFSIFAQRTRDDSCVCLRWFFISGRRSSRDRDVLGRQPDQTVGVKVGQDGGG